MKPRSPKTSSLLVTVVSKNATTADALKTYLQGAGVVVTTTSEIGRIVAMTPPSTAAVILFPDEYEAEVALPALSQLKKARPETLAVIVTNEPRRFECVGSESARVAEPLVLAKPAWAWTILDAVRARLHELGALAAGDSNRADRPRKGRA
jgi:hypothetical protein